MNRFAERLRHGMRGMAVCALLAPSLAHALPDDFKAAIDVEAEYVEVDSTNRSSVYRGDVRFSRGSMELRADQVTVTQDAKNGNVRAVVTGNPAKYSQIPRKDAGRVHAEAQRIEYGSSDAVIRLIGNAKIHRGTDEITGAEIRYHMREDRIIAGGGEQGGRVKITIQPPSSGDSETDSSGE